MRPGRLARTVRHRGNMRCLSTSYPTCYIVITILHPTSRGLQFMTHSGTISDVPINIFCRKDRINRFTIPIMCYVASSMALSGHVIITPRKLGTDFPLSLVTELSIFCRPMDVSALFPIFTPFSRIAKNVRHRP